MEALIALIVILLLASAFFLCLISSQIAKMTGRFDQLDRAIRHISDEVREVRRGGAREMPAPTQEQAGLSREKPLPDAPPVSKVAPSSEAREMPGLQRPRPAPPFLAPVPQRREPEETPVYTASVVEVSGSGSHGRPSPRGPQLEPGRRRPSAIEIRALRILRKTWNWIIVGEEYVPEGVSLEYAVATHWLLRVGVLILVIGLGFFLAYSIERGYLGPEARVTLITLAGFGMLIGGTQMLGRRYHILGQGLLGAGTAALYGAVFAAFSRHHFIEQLPAFALMAGVTVLSAGIAIRFRSLLTAILGAVGGYLTPVLLASGSVNFVGLYSYLLILSLGVLGIGYYRDWPILRYVSFAGTYLLVVSSMAEDYRDGDFWYVMPFLIAFFVVFSMMSFVFQLSHRRKTSLLELGNLCANGAVFFALAYLTVRDAFGRTPTAYVTLGLAAYYTAHVWWFLSRKRPDRALLLGCLGLAAFFLAITMPIVLSKQWLTASWAVLGLILLWIGFRLKSPVVRSMAYVLDALVLFRFGLVDLPRSYPLREAADLTWSAYWPDMFRRFVSLGVPVGCLGGSYRLLRANESETLPVGGNMAAAMLLSAVGGLFVMLHLEMARTFGAFAPAIRVPMLTMLWIALCAFLLDEARRRKSEPWLALFCAAAVGLGVKLLVYDIPSWSEGRRLVESFVYGNGMVYSGTDALMRLWDCAAVVAFCWFVYARLRGGRQPEKQAAAGFAAAAVAVLFVFATLELRTALSVFAPEMRDGGISVLWSVFALALVAVGIARESRVSRYVGLALFVVVVAKVFAVDLDRATEGARIIAFVALGIILMCGSFVYLKSRERFSRRTESKDETEVDA